MTNLLEETVTTILDNKANLEDIIWVGTQESSMSWDEFVPIARSINYDSGFGIEYINIDLMVVSKNWWLERHTYDGSEWWEFKTIPIQPPIGQINIKNEW